MDEAGQIRLINLYQSLNIVVSPKNDATIFSIKKEGDTICM